MGMPDWWGQRRYGLFVHANVATVPAWAPIGQYADWYWSHLGDDLPDVLLHPQPMVEVVAHHRDRWGHVERFDDFVPLLTFDRFDPEVWARLAVDAGMGYTVFVSKHHDGWCWWDAPGTSRTFVAQGPRRDVLAEYAAACERNDLVFGTYYSILDWGDPRYPGDDYVRDVLHPHVLDLVERFGSRILWGDGHWGHGPDRWRTAELLSKALEIDAELMINDRWWARQDDLPSPILRTFEYETPDDILDEPWELCRGIGSSFCHNRLERAEHHLSAIDIVALYTEVLAKGGNLLLNVGPDVGGVIPDLQAAPLRDAGTWIRAHPELARSSPWTKWGDEHVRYLMVDGVLHAADVSGRGDFAALLPDAARVTGVTHVTAADPHGEPESIRFHQDHEGLHLDVPRSPAERWNRTTPSVDIALYRIGLEPVAPPVELFPPQPARSIELAPLLASARPGDIVQLGDGRHVGPATVPAGVVLRGLGARRTTIEGGGAPALTLERGARVEHLRVTGAAPRIAWFPTPAVVLEGQFGTLLGCEVEGHVIVRANDALIRACSLRGVVGEQADRTTISRCVVTGMRWDVGIELAGGVDHEIDTCELADHLCAIRLVDTLDSAVVGNTIEARWWGVHLRGAERARVTGNRIRSTMRAVDVEGGISVRVDGNAVFDGDSGCLVEAGASNCLITGNHWERCRVGAIVWDSVDVHQHDNQAIDLHEPNRETIVGS